MFIVAAEAYDRFMGRYSVPLASAFADFAGVAQGQRVLDVGCGPGALTRVLVERVGSGAVSAVDPSEPFVEAARSRHPGVDLRQAPAEDLPFADGSFDTAMAQLVVHFMSDPVRGLGEMARVTRPGGTIAACVWDHGGSGSGPLTPFWAAARAVDPDVVDESNRPGSNEGDLTSFFEAAGIEGVEETTLSVSIEHGGFDAWWEPFTLGVGPAGVYLARLDEDRQARVREACRAEFPADEPLHTVRAWTARGRSPG